METAKPLLMATDMKMDWRPLVAATGKLAQAWSRPVVPVHVVTVDTDSVLVDYYRRQLTQQLFEPLMQEVAGQSWTMQHPVVLTGAIVDRLVSYGLQHESPLIVMGAGRVGPTGTLVPGTFTEAVLQQSRRPVLAVHPSQPLEFARIVCPVDNSATARRGLHNAIQLARTFGAALTVMTVVPEISWLEAAAEVRTLTNAIEEYSLEWEQEFDKSLQSFDFSGVEWTRVVKFGSPADEIAAEAQRQNADLLMVGAIGRSGLAQAMLGSTVRRLFRQLPCSVLVVHDEDLPTPADPC